MGTLTSCYHLESARYGLVPDAVVGPTGQRPVIEIGHRRVPEHAGRPVGHEPLRADVDRLTGVVELPPEPFGRRVRVDFAQHVHALAPGRADHQHPVRFAPWRVCKRKQHADIRRDSRVLFFFFYANSRLRRRGQGEQSPEAL